MKQIKSQRIKLKFKNTITLRRISNSNKYKAYSIQIIELFDNMDQEKQQDIDNDRSQPITSFIKDDGQNAGSQYLEDGNQFKDYELLSDSVTNNMGPVIFQAPQSEAAVLNKDQIKLKKFQKPLPGQHKNKQIIVELPEDLSTDFKKSQDIAYQSSQNISHSFIQQQKLPNGSAAPTENQVLVEQSSQSHAHDSITKLRMSTGQSTGKLLKGERQSVPIERIQNQGDESRQELSHKEIMAEIESGGDRTRSQLKRYGSIDGTGATVESFMQKAQRAAHNFAKETKNSSIQQEQITSARRQVDQKIAAFPRQKSAQATKQSQSSLQQSQIEKIRVLQNVAFNQDATPTITPRGAREQQNMAQMSDRPQNDHLLPMPNNQRSRRIVTATDSKKTRNNQRRNQYMTKRSQSRGMPLGEMKASDMMSQTQQNLNKLRMSRACQSNLNLVSMRAADQQLMSGGLSILGQNIDHTSAGNIKSQAALMEYRNSIQGNRKRSQKRNADAASSAEGIPPIKSYVHSAISQNMTHVQTNTISKEGPGSTAEYIKMDGGNMNSHSQVPILDLNRNSTKILFEKTAPNGQELMINVDTKRIKSSHQKYRGKGSIQPRRNIQSNEMLVRKHKRNRNSNLNSNPNLNYNANLHNATSQSYSMNKIHVISAISPDSGGQINEINMFDQPPQASLIIKSAESHRQLAKRKNYEEMQMRTKSNGSKNKNIRIEICNENEGPANEDLLDSTQKLPLMQSKLNQDLRNVQYKPMVMNQEVDNTLNKTLRIEKLKYATKALNHKKGSPGKVDQGQQLSSDLRITYPNISFSKQASSPLRKRFSLVDGETQFAHDFTHQIQDSFNRFELNESHIQYDSQEVDSKNVHFKENFEQLTLSQITVQQKTEVQSPSPSKENNVPWKKLGVMNVQVAGSFPKAMSMDQFSPLSPQSMGQFCSNQNRRQKVEQIIQRYNELHKPESDKKAAKPFSRSPKAKEAPSPLYVQGTANVASEHRGRSGFSRGSSYVANQKYNKMKNEVQYQQTKLNDFQKEQTRNCENQKQAVYSKHKRSLSVISGLTGSVIKINDPQTYSQLKREKLGSKCEDQKTSNIDENTKDLDLDVEIQAQQLKIIGSELMRHPGPHKAITNQILRNNKTLLSMDPNQDIGTAIHDEELQESDDQVIIESKMTCRENERLETHHASQLDIEDQKPDYQQQLLTKQKSEKANPKIQKIRIQRNNNTSERSKTGSKIEARAVSSQYLSRNNDKTQGFKSNASSPQDAIAPAAPSSQDGLDYQMRSAEHQVKSHNDGTSDTRTVDAGIASAADVANGNLQSFQSQSIDKQFGDEKITIKDLRDSSKKQLRNNLSTVGSQRSSAKENKAMRLSLDDIKSGSIMRIEEEELQLKTVRESEDAENLFLEEAKAIVKEEAKKLELRRKSREEFEQRNNSLQMRKSSAQLKCKTNQDELKRNIMSTPIQQLGKVSMMSIREEANISEDKYKARNDFLKKNISIKTKPEQDYMNDKLPGKKKEDCKKKCDDKHKHQTEAENPLNMNISPRLCQKLNDQYEENKRIIDLAHADHHHSHHSTEKRKTICPKERFHSYDLPTKFKMELIQTKEDENVFNRLNPNILDVKNNIDLPEYLRHVSNKKPSGKAKKYHEMNEYEKDTFNLIKNLRRELTAENLQAKLLSYIRTNHDEKMINQFCQELIQTKLMVKAHDASHGHSHGGGHGKKKAPGGGHGHGAKQPETQKQKSVSKAAISSHKASASHKESTLKLSSKDQSTHRSKGQKPPKGIKDYDRKRRAANQSANSMNEKRDLTLKIKIPIDGVSGKSIKHQMSQRHSQSPSIKSQAKSLGSPSRGKSAGPKSSQSYKALSQKGLAKSARSQSASHKHKEPEKIMIDKDTLYNMAPSKFRNDMIVELYYQTKHDCEHDDEVKEAAEQQFLKFSKQKKGTRFFLSKQERENILGKLDDIWILQEKQEKYMRRRQKMYQEKKEKEILDSDLNYFYEQKQKNRDIEIKQKIVERLKIHAEHQELEKESLSTDKEKTVAGTVAGASHAPHVSNKETTYYDGSILHGSTQNHRRSSTGSQAVAFADQQPEEIEWGPPPEDAALLSQEGINFLPQEQKEPLQDLFKKAEHNQDLKSQTGSELEEKTKEELEEMGMLDLGKKSNTYAYNTQDYRINNQAYEKELELLPEDTRIRVDNELDDDGFFDEYRKQYRQQQAKIDQKYAASPKIYKKEINIPISEDNENSPLPSRSPESKMESPKSPTKGPYNVWVPRRSTEKVKPSPRQTINAQLNKEPSNEQKSSLHPQRIAVDAKTSFKKEPETLFQQKTSLKEKTAYFQGIDEMNMMDPTENGQISFDQNLQITTVFETKLRDPNYTKLAQTAVANLNLLKNIQQKKNMQRSRWGLKSAAVNLSMTGSHKGQVVSKYSAQASKQQRMETWQKQSQNTYAKQLNKKNQRPSAKNLSCDRSKLFNIARQCQYELAENEEKPLLTKDGKTYCKSSTNLKAFSKKLDKCSKHQEAIVDNIVRVENNMEKVRFNYEADQYEDILISNIQDEQMVAKKSEDLRISECRKEVKSQKHINNLLRDLELETYKLL